MASPTEVFSQGVQPDTSIEPNVESIEVEPLLWKFPSALLFIIIFTIAALSSFYGVGAFFDIQNVKDNWAEKRCSPLIIPFASLFGYDTEENFKFCMNDTFNIFAAPFMGTTSGMFSSITGLLTIIFGSIGSLRITIATLGGGINTIIQEFTERITMFFFKIRISAITIKTLITRMYAILFSVMYMGISGISGMSSFTNTTLFSFLDTFCFPGNTELLTDKGPKMIKDIKIGDVIQSEEKSIVTGTFVFYAKGQPMVKIGSTSVSTNHYMIHHNTIIKAANHPDAVKIEDSKSELYCLNTHNNRIPIKDLIFLDYDETAEGDKETMNYIEGRVNACYVNKEYEFTEYCPAIDENTYVKTTDGDKMAKDVKIGDIFVTGSDVIGFIRKVVHETSIMDGVTLTPSTLYWDKNVWKRVGDHYETIKGTKEMVSFIAVPNSQIELQNGVRIRDYMELCSPDSEMYYTKRLET
jgi:hypothetical protein